MTKKVLVIAGPLADYHYRLFEKVRQLVNTEWLFLLSTRKSQGEFAHENFVPRRFEFRDLGESGLFKSVLDVIKFKPHVIFFYGNTHKFLLAISAFLGSLWNAKMYYASDDNIDKIKSLGNRLGKAALFSFLSLIKVEFLSLGYSNHLFFTRHFVHKIHEIPCYAVAFDEWDERYVEKDQDTDKRVKLSTISRLVERKNIKNLIQAFKRLSEEFDDICLNVIGDGPCFQELIQLIDTVPKAKIKLLGSVDRHEIGAYIFSHDVLVLPSFDEPWGIVVVEALGCGKPVIATRHVGAAFSLCGIVGGVILSEDTSAEGLYDALKTYLQNKLQYDCLAQNQKEWVVKKYGRSFVAKEYALLIDEKCEI